MSHLYIMTEHYAVLFAFYIVLCLNNCIYYCSFQPSVGGSCRQPLSSQQQQQDDNKDEYSASVLDLKKRLERIKSSMK